MIWQSTKIAATCLALALCGCATETRVISDHTAAAKFESILGGSSAGGAWTVEGTDVNKPKHTGPAPVMIGTTNNFSHLTIRTSNDPPAGAQSDPGAMGQPVPMGPGMISPWGAAPSAPAH